MSDQHGGWTRTRTETSKFSFWERDGVEIIWNRRDDFYIGPKRQSKTMILFYKDGAYPKLATDTCFPEFEFDITQGHPLRLLAVVSIFLEKKFKFRVTDDLK